MRYKEGTICRVMYPRENVPAYIKKIKNWETIRYVTIVEYTHLGTYKCVTCNSLGVIDDNNYSIVYLSKHNLYEYNGKTGISENDIQKLEDISKVLYAVKNAEDIFGDDFDKACNSISSLYYKLKLIKGTENM